MKTTLSAFLIFLVLTGCSANTTTASKPTPELSSEKIYQLGVKQRSKHNYTQAIKLFEKAADLGNFKAQNDLGVIFFEGSYARIWCMSS